MDFSALRQRIVFLKPLDTKLNAMRENVPVWIPFKPNLRNNLIIDDKSDVYITEDKKGNAVLKTVDGQPYAHRLSIKEFSVWAYVAPATGREYEEAQKLREETTYQVKTRYFPRITMDMKILYDSQILDIVSVLDVGGRKIELQIVAKERDRNGKEC